MPFDTSAIRTITYNNNLRIDEVKASIPKIAESLNSTFSSSDDSGYSLLKLLSIQKPATIPDGHKLSEDSSMILDSIQELKQQINQINKRRTFSYPSQRDDTFIINGEPFSIGDDVFITDPNNKSKQYLGKLYKVTDDFYQIQDDNNIRGLHTTSEEAQRLSNLPL